LTSLLGNLIPLFSGHRRIEDLFTETVARLFERRQKLCLDWLEEAGLHTARVKDRTRVHVTTQKTFKTEDGSVIRPDLWVEVHRVSDENLAEGEALTDVVMIESKIGAREEKEQLKKYADHLAKMTGFDSRTLIYITRAYDPKKEDEVVSEPGEVDFKSLRWHDFYHFLGTTEKDVLVEEII